MKISGLMTIATLSVTVCAGAAFAESASVSRCNFSEGASYKPGLWITQDGVTRLVKVNEEGLTRRIIFDDKLAMEYVRAQMGGDAGSSHVSITNSCSSSTYSYAAEEDAVVIKIIEKVACGEGGCEQPECGPIDIVIPDCGAFDGDLPRCGPIDTGLPSSIEFSAEPF